MTGEPEAVKTSIFREGDFFHFEKILIKEIVSFRFSLVVAPSFSIRQIRQRVNDYTTANYDYIISY